MLGDFVDDFFNRGRRWGYLRFLVVLGILIVFMYIGRVGFEDIDMTAVIDAWRAQYPILNAVPDILLKGWAFLFSGGNFRYLFLPLAALLGAIFFGSRFVQDTYLIQRIWTSLHYLLAALFGISYPRLTISKGKMETNQGGDNLLQMIGGPGILDVRSGNLVLLEQLSGANMILLEGNNYINQLWKIKEVVSLDEQHGFIEEVRGRSKDGIPIRVVGVSFRYKLATGDVPANIVIPTLAIPYPYNEDAFRNMAYNRSVTRDDGLVSWHRAVTGVVEGAIREFVNQHQFDRITAPNFLGGEPREEILGRVFSPSTLARLHSLGAELQWVSIGHFGVDEKVKEQRLDTWGARWVGDATVENAYGEAQRLTYQELGRAEGQAMLIMSIIHALSEVAPAGTAPRDLNRIVLVRTAQILEALAQPAKSLPPPKTEGKPPRKPRSRQQP